MKSTEPQVYLDYNATTPLAPEVLDAMLPYLRNEFGNPSSIHGLGRRASAALADARGAVADFVGASESEIVLTGGGTESDNLAILGVAAAAPGDRRHLVASSIEHHAVIEVMGRLEKDGYELTLVDVDERGVVDPAAFRSALRSDTLIASVMTANNETGVIQPVAALASSAHETGALFHTDAVQACGKIPVDVNDLGVDLLSLSAHKFCGPNGVGALFIRSGVAFEPLFHGGGQESARRPGTENVAGAVGLAEACRQVSARLEAEADTLRAVRDELQSLVLADVAGSHVNGDGAERTPNTVNVRFDGVDGRELVLRLDEAGFAVSTGAACTAGGTGSHVLSAMGLGPEAVRGSIRVSLGRYTEERDMRAFADAVADAVRSVRTSGPVAEAR